jgi:type I restriction enzyme S subunit
MSNATSHIDNKPSLQASHCEDEGRSKLKQSHPLVPALRFKEFEGKWQILKLMEVAKIARGKFTPRPRNNPIYYNGDIPFIQTSDVVNANGKIEVYTQTLNEKGLAVSKLFPAGTILITIAANIGHVGVLQIDMACPDSLIGITPNDETHNYFLNYYLATHQKKMDYLAPEGAQKNINIDFLNPYKVPSTSLPEQQKIASFLSAVDEKIQQLTKKKALLEEYKKGVMQQLFSGQLRFKGENGKDYPDWEEKRLGEVSTFLDGRRKPIKGGDRSKMQGEYPYYGASGIIDYVNNYIFDEEIILLGEDGENIISRNLPLAFRVSGKCWINNHAHVIKPNENTDIDFLTYSLELINYEPYNTGTAQPKLNQAVCRSLPLNLPSYPEQQKIATYLSRIDTKIGALNNQITQTQTFKKGLLQGMFV